MATTKAELTPSMPSHGSEHFVYSPASKLEIMSGSTISRVSGRRLALVIEDRRSSLVSSIVGSSVLPRPGSLAANAFVNAFLDRLAHELETGECEPLGEWIAAGPAAERTPEYARIVVIAFATVGTAYAAAYGHADEVVGYLALRSGELEKFFTTSPVARPNRLLDPTKMVDRDEVVASLLSAIDARDPATCEHSRAVGMWSGRMAKHMGMNAEAQEFAALAGTLHDVGKIATPTEVLLKPGALNEEEWEAMRAHSRIGAKMLERIPSLREIAPVVRAHHERIDGMGYPDRLSGDSIPTIARIVAVADSFHAMISKRPYRQAMPVAKALDELRRGIETQWDRSATEAMLAIVQPAGVVRSIDVKRSVG